jgi:hypothetical protein
VLSQLDAEEIKHNIYDSTGKVLLEDCPWFPVEFIDFSLYLFTVINHNDGYD